MVHIFGHYVDAGAFWGIVATLVVGLAGIVISVILYKWAKKAGASREQVEKLQNQVDAIAVKSGALHRMWMGCRKQRLRSETRSQPA